jgi:hypothetical protein
MNPTWSRMAATSAAGFVKSSHSLAFTLRYPDAGEQLHVILWVPIRQPLRLRNFQTGSPRSSAWVVDTAREAPRTLQ